MSTHDDNLTFTDLDLPSELLTAVARLGFATPTPIQAQAIPLLIAGHDVLGVAQTGTGKTAAFGLPMLMHVDPELKAVQALVLAPTRELAMQGADALSTFGAEIGGLNVVAVYGGSAYGPQLGALRDGAQVVVGTPGRIMDLIDRGALDLSGVKYFVLDEADEMLRMGFAEDVETIAAGLPDDRISALFSATMPKQIRKVAEDHLNDPVEVTVTPAASTVDTITQMYAVVPERYKIGALARVLATTQADAALVFVRTRSTAEELAIELSTRGVHTAALSGDVQQKDREKLVNRLRHGTLDVLVATDVAARGLDVERIGLVVNFDVPREVDTYVHRIGRTGRAGREGRALTFVTPKERNRLRRIEKVTGAELEEVQLPTPAEVSILRANQVMLTVRDRYKAGRLGIYRDVLEAFDTSQQDQYTQLSHEDIIYALLALAVKDPGPGAGDEPDILTSSFDDDRRGRKGRDREGRGCDSRGDSRAHRGSRRKPTFEGDGTRYRIEVGRKDGVSPGEIVGAITNEGGIAGSQLGRIDIFPTFSLVELRDELDERTQRKIARASVKGRALRIARDKGPSSRHFGDSDEYRGPRRRRPGADDSRSYDGTRSYAEGDREPWQDRGYNNTEPEQPRDDRTLRKYRADRKFGDDRRALKTKAFASKQARHNRHDRRGRTSGDTKRRTSKR
ncbi:MAG: DEAD/DEAH box helicase [Actinomycetaceae bacterium]|nr:DEAD/DEAH box helicase [Arcanobacterium sp.]MDD7505873.1 DEAD/DEAH box helicase [Actinomycetaceae bacterium]MDY6143679.1 DEAD/DEAH box helicase [Arcanobacterium sp.]